MSQVVHQYKLPAGDDRPGTRYHSLIVREMNDGVVLAIHKHVVTPQSSPDHVEAEELGHELFEDELRRLADDLLRHADAIATRRMRRQAERQRVAELAARR